MDTKIGFNLSQLIETAKNTPMPEKGVHVPVPTAEEQAIVDGIANNSAVLLGKPLPKSLYGDADLNRVKKFLQTQHGLSFYGLSEDSATVKVVTFQRRERKNK